MNKDNYFDLLKSSAEPSIQGDSFGDLLNECRRSSKESINETDIYPAFSDARNKGAGIEDAVKAASELPDWPLQQTIFVLSKDARVSAEDKEEMSLLSKRLSPEESKEVEEQDESKKMNEEEAFEIMTIGMLAHRIIDHGLTQIDDPELLTKDIALLDDDELDQLEGAVEDSDEKAVKRLLAVAQKRIPESKEVDEEKEINEQEPDVDLPEKPRTEPEAEEPASAAPPPPEEVKEPEEPMEMRKEYLGKTEDTHFYFLTIEGEARDIEDFVITDQEGVKKYSARDKNIEIMEGNIADFLISAIRDLDIAQIERSIFMKYIYPKLIEKAPEEEVIEEPEEKPEGEVPAPEEELAPEEEAPPRESKELGEQVDLDEHKLVAVEAKKVNEKELEIRDALILLDFAAFKLFKKEHKDCSPEEKREVKQYVMSYLDYREEHPMESKKVSEQEIKKEDVPQAVSVTVDRYEAARMYSMYRSIHQGELSIEEFVKLCVENLIDRYFSSEYIKEDDVESFVDLPYEEEEMEEKKSKNLHEMKITDDEGNEFDVYLVDDGTMDTVISISGREFRFSPEFASMWRDEEGALSEEGLRELALDALANMEEEDYNELVGQAAAEEASEENAEMENAEPEVDEKKKPPVCKKCGKRHWPFQKCKEVKEEVEEGKDQPGVRDGTGPAKGSHQQKTKGIGKRKEAGEKCPYEGKEVEKSEDFDISKMGDDELVAKYEEAISIFKEAGIKPSSGILGMLVDMRKEIKKRGLDIGESTNHEKVVSELIEATKSEVIELLKQGKIVYGVAKDVNSEDSYLVGKISNLKEYEKSGYWDIVGNYPTEEEAVAAAEKLSKGGDGVFIGVQESKKNENSEGDSSMKVEEKLYTKQFEDLSVGADFMLDGKRCTKYSETEYKHKDKVHKITPKTEVEAIEKPRRGKSKESVEEASEGTKIDVYTSADDKTPQKATMVSMERGKPSTAKLGGKTIKITYDDRSDKWIIREDNETRNENSEGDDNMDKKSPEDLIKVAEEHEALAKEAREEAAKLEEEASKKAEEEATSTDEGVNPKDDDSEEKKIKKLSEEDEASEEAEEAPAEVAEKEDVDVKDVQEEKVEESVVSETDVAKGTKELIKLAKEALNKGDYGKAAEWCQKLAEIENIVPSEAEAEVKAEEKPEEPEPEVEESDQPEDLGSVITDELQEDLENLLDEGKLEEVDKALDEAAKKKGRPLKKGAARRSRGDCVFQSTNPKVMDNADHFPINSENQARNALARANQYKKAPKWYKGSLDSLVKAVAKAVKKKYPDIKVSKAAERPGKDGKKESKIQVEDSTDISETKSIERLRNLLEG